MFECHITCPLEQAEIAEDVAKEFHWKTSEIARDPVLGKQTYFYLTTHSNDLPEMMRRMREVTSALWSDGVTVLREKIEVIIHDKRYE